MKRVYFTFFTLSTSILSSQAIFIPGNSCFKGGYPEFGFSECERLDTTTASNSSRSTSEPPSKVGSFGSSPAERTLFLMSPLTQRRDTVSRSYLSPVENKIEKTKKASCIDIHMQKALEAEKLVEKVLANPQAIELLAAALRDNPLFCNALKEEGQKKDCFYSQPSSEQASVVSSDDECSDV